MRKIVFISFFILLSIKNYGQFATMFNDTLRTFGSGGYYLKNVIQDSGIYYISGVFNSAIGQYPFVIKMNDIGTVLNKQLYTDTIYGYGVYPYNSMIINNSNLLFCSQYISSKGTVGFVSSINKHTLDTLWTKTYVHPDTLIAQTASDVFSVLTSIKSTPAGGYILTGNYNKNCITGNLRSFLMKIDSVGNVEWRRTYTSYYTFFDVEIAQDSGYYVPSGLNGTNALQLVKYDKSGLFQWRVGVTTNNMAGYPIEMSLYGNNYAIVGYKYLYDVSNHLTAVSVSKVDLISKTIVWEKVYYLYHKFECISLHQAMGVETLSDGNIIISGTSARYGYDAVILKLNSNGDSLWCKSYDFHPDPYDCQLNDLSVCDDGGFMGVGFFDDQAGHGSAAWLFKTDKNGVVGFETSTPLSVQKVKVWPNPASDYTKINTGQALNQTSEIIIYNSLGQIVETISVHKQQLEIEVNLHDFKVGLYYFELRTVNKIIGSGKFIKE